MCTRVYLPVCACVHACVCVCACVNVQGGWPPEWRSGRGSQPLPLMSPYGSCSDGTGLELPIGEEKRGK